MIPCMWEKISDLLTACACHIKKDLFIEVW